MMQRSKNIERVNGYSKDSYTYYPVIIIGAGESGIATGCRLKEALGFDQFRIFERQSGAGGTWWINRYPGVACDVPALFYSFSFCPNHAWSSFFPEGPEILKYMHDVCAKYGITDKIQCDTDVSEARWLEEEQEWQVTIRRMVPGTGDLSRQERQKIIQQKGEEAIYISTEIARAKIVLSCAGGLVEPSVWPSEIPGHETFQGPIFHTARWREDIDLQDKDVIVIGTGCSAAQVVPKLTQPPYNAKSATQLMRTPPWVAPRAVPPYGNKAWSKHSPWYFTNIPGLAKVARLAIFAAMESDHRRLFKLSDYSKKWRARVEESLLKHMKKTVPEEYHEILTPNYSVGCKRRIFDASWLASFNDPRNRLTTKPLTSVQSHGITIGPGRTYPPMDRTDSKVDTSEEQLPADAIILANGFEVKTWLAPLTVYGRDGRLLEDVWTERGGPQAYLGTAMDGFPNFHIIFGPNTATGHSSVILASENMVEYSLKFVKQVLRGDVKTFEVKKEREIAWTSEIQQSLKKTVFNSGGCNSWYKSADGWNATAYPYSQVHFTYRCMFPRWDDWNIKYTEQGLRRRRRRQVYNFLAVTICIIGIWMTRRYSSGGVQDVLASSKYSIRSALLFIFT